MLNERNVPEEGGAVEDILLDRRKGLMGVMVGAERRGAERRWIDRTARRVVEGRIRNDMQRKAIAFRSSIQVSRREGNSVVEEKEVEKKEQAIMGRAQISYLDRARQSIIPLVGSSASSRTVCFPPPPASPGNTSAITPPNNQFYRS